MFSVKNFMLKDFFYRYFFLSFSKVHRWFAKVSARMEKKDECPFIEPKVKERKKQNDDGEAALRDWWKQVQAGKWSDSVWENAQKHRQQLGNPPPEDQSNRPQFRKRATKNK